MIWYVCAVKNKVLITIIFCFISTVLPINMCRAYTLGQLPENWVTVQRYEDISDESNRNSRTDVQYLLVDRQLCVSSTNTEEYFHFAYKILSHAGVHNYSELEFDLNPIYQQLSIHEVKIIRGANVIDGIPISEFKTIQREQDLDRKIFDGRQTIVAFLSDVRLGDIIEFSYTVAGKNPAMKDHFSKWVRTQWSLPVTRM